MGRATALELARQGAKVVIAARREAEGEATARLAKEQGGEARFVRCDVSVAEDVERLVRATVEAYGGRGGVHDQSGDAGIDRRDAPAGEDW